MTPQLGDQYLDSRDIETRIDELVSDIENYMEENDIYKIDDVIRDIHPELQEYEDELKRWQDFKNDGENGEWPHGQTFIHEDYWEDYVQELCEDIGAVSNIDDNWWIVIDWTATATNVAMDYTIIEIENETYYTRS